MFIISIHPFQLQPWFFCFSTPLHLKGFSLLHIQTRLSPYFSVTAPTSCSCLSYWWLRSSVVHIPKTLKFLYLKLYIHLLNKSCWLCPQCILNPTLFTVPLSPSSASHQQPLNRPYCFFLCLLTDYFYHSGQWCYEMEVRLCYSLAQPFLWLLGSFSVLLVTHKAPIYFLFISLPRPLKSEMVPSSP